MFRTAYVYAIGSRVIFGKNVTTLVSGCRRVNSDLDELCLIHCKINAQVIALRVIFTESHDPLVGEALLDCGPLTVVGKIADETGFYDAAHFMKTFTSVVGMSPAEYKMSESAASKYSGLIH